GGLAPGRLSGASLAASHIASKPRPSVVSGAPPIGLAVQASTKGGAAMGTLTPLAISAGGIVGFGVLYVLLLLILGIRSIKRGHWIMFLLGIPLPIFWLIGGLMPPAR